MSSVFKENNSLLIAIPSEKHINFQIVTQLKSEILKYIDKGQKHILINLTHVSSIDSSSLGSFISIGQKLLGTQGSLSFCNVAPSICSIFNTTNISSLFTIYENEALAITSYDSKENLPLIAYIGSDRAFFQTLNGPAKSIAIILFFEKMELFTSSNPQKYCAILIDEELLNEEIKKDFLKDVKKLVVIKEKTAIKHLKKLKAMYEIRHSIELPISSDETTILLSELVKETKSPLIKNALSPAEMLFEKYSESLFDKLEEIEQLFESLKQTITKENLEKLHATIHKLSGSAGSYGYVKAGQISKHIELLLEKSIAENSDDLDFIKKMEKLIEKMKFYFNTTFYRASDQQNTAIRPITPKSIYLTTQNEGVALFFTNIAKEWNFTIEIAKNPDSAINQLELLEFKPEIIIVENKFFSTSLDGISLIKAIKNKLSAEKITFGLLVEEDSLELSIKANKEGIDLIIKKPPSAQQIAKVLENFSKETNSNAYKVLVIDDDVDIGNLVISAADQQNVHIQTLTDETKMLETLYEFGPNLLLLDIHLTKYDGWSLLKTLRSDLRYRDLKIIIITGSLQGKNFFHGLYDDLWLKPLDKIELQNNLLLFAKQHQKKYVKEHIFTSIFSMIEFKKIATVLLNAVQEQDSYYFSIIKAKEFNLIKQLGPGAIQEYLIATENLISEKILGDSVRGYLGEGKFGFIFPSTQKNHLLEMLTEFCASSDYKVSIPSKQGNVFVTFVEKTETYTPSNKSASEFLEETIENFDYVKNIFE